MERFKLAQQWNNMKISPDPSLFAIQTHNLRFLSMWLPYITSKQLLHSKILWNIIIKDWNFSLNISAASPLHLEY